MFTGLHIGKVLSAASQGTLPQLGFSTEEGRTTKRVKPSGAKEKRDMSTRHLLHQANTEHPSRNEKF